MDDVEALRIELEILKKEVATTKAEIASAEAEDSSARAILADIESMSVFQYFQEDRNLPKLWEVGGDPKPNQKYAPIKSYKELEFGLIPVREDLFQRTKLRITKMFEVEVLDYGTERDLEYYCKIVLEDILSAGAFSNKLYLRWNTSIVELKNYFLVISFNGYPVGAVAVNKPETLTKRCLPPFRARKMKSRYGQIFDYLMRIRSYHGVRFVFGIVTDFEEWRICWLPDSESLALSNDPNFIPTEPILDVKIGEKRHLQISRPYYATHTKPLAYALYFLLYKVQLVANLVNPVPFLSKNRSYIVMKERKWVWRSNITTEEVSFIMPDQTIKEFYLLHDFHGGADGRVWLAGQAKTGAMVVIKFPQEDELQTVRKEVSYWHRVGFPEVYHLKLANRQAIIMPFAFHYKKSEETSEIVIDDTWWSKETNSSLPIKDFDEALKEALTIDPKEALEICIQIFSSAKLVHDDIKWRHVALFPRYEDLLSSKKVVLKPCFIDLSRVEEQETEEQAEQDMRKEMSQLLIE